MIGRTDRRLRLLVLLLVFAAMSGALVTRLAYWQLARGAELREMAASQMVRATEEQPVRGDILDRRGTVLATTEWDDLLAAYPDRIPDDLVPAYASRIAGILGWADAERARLAEQLASGARYVVIERRLTDTESAAIREAVDSDDPLSGLALEPRPYRVYPNPGGAPGTTLASQLLGFVTEDGAGHYGVEQQYDEALSGEPRIVESLRDARGLSLDSTARVLDPGVPGADVRLTIDSSLQLQLEKELYAAWVADRAKRVSAVVLDPHDGQVLAWASVPGYDANEFASIAQRSSEPFQDPIISAVYEPGSVMKSFTAAAALGNESVTLDTVVRDTFSLDLGGESVHNADRRARGLMRFKNVIAYSRNVATARVALRIGRDIDESSRLLYETWQAFGIGRPTGVDLGNEVAGIAVDPRRQEWQPIDLANRAFGQGVAATVAQLAVGYAAMSNGGMKVQPYVAASVGEEERAVVPPKRAIDADLAAMMKGLLAHVVSHVPWYAEGTLIPGYEVGGKTGTAQIWDSRRNEWLRNTFNFSFGGFVGTNGRAEAIIVTRIHETEPHVRGQGDLALGITSFELFRRIAIDTMTALDIPPVRPARPPDDERGQGQPRAGRESDAAEGTGR